MPQQVFVLAGATKIIISKQARVIMDFLSQVISLWEHY
jgi:hypothetical protein